MALVLNDRVKETSTTAGTVTQELAGAVTGFEGFVAGIGNTNTTYYRYFYYQYQYHYHYGYDYGYACDY